MILLTRVKLKTFARFKEIIMKKISCAILGYGDRSGRYAAYAEKHPEELEVIAVIDYNQLKLICQHKFKKI